MLQERILRTLEKRKDGVDQRKLSRVANLNESSVSRFLKSHEEMNFESVLRIVKFLYPDEEKEIMQDYVKTQKSKNARHALEYCVMNYCWEQADELIELLSNSSNPVDREWAAIYDLIRMRRDKLLSPIELLQQVEVIKPKEPEMQILKTLLKGYLYFDMAEQHSLFLHMEGIDTLISELTSNFMKDSFQVRLSLVMNTVYLYANHLEKSRHYSYAIIGQDFFEDKKAAAYNNLGLSYMLEDYQKAKDYFMKALKVYVTYDQHEYVKIVKLNLSFLSSYWGINREFTEPLEGQRNYINYIYYLIKKGELSLAQELISRVDLEELTEWDKAFYYYYKGLLTDDVTTFYCSVELFIHMDNHLYLQLPLIELKRLGENDKVLKILSSIRRNLSEKTSKVVVRK